MTNEKRYELQVRILVFMSAFGHRYFVQYFEFPDHTDVYIGIQVPNNSQRKQIEILQTNGSCAIYANLKSEEINEIYESMDQVARDVGLSLPRDTEDRADYEQALCLYRFK